MHVETICPGCQRKLRVGVEHAGQTARCPVCNAVYTVPRPEDAKANVDPTDQWRLQTPEGKQYGPVEKVVLERWITEGRVTDECKLMSVADGVWRDADELYPVLSPEPVRPWAVGPLAADPFEAATEPALAVSGRVQNPHRGGLILALGILSWAVGCPVFGVVAWVMGSNDLAEMRAGVMDAQGQSLTEAGRWIGMIHTFIALTVILVGILALLILRVL